LSRFCVVGYQSSGSGFARCGVGRSSDFHTSFQIRLSRCSLRITLTLTFSFIFAQLLLLPKQPVSLLIFIKLSNSRQCHAVDQIQLCQFGLGLVPLLIGFSFNELLDVDLPSERRVLGTSRRLSLLGLLGYLEAFGGPLRVWLARLLSSI
jgi:hypothetical protein